MLHTPAPCYLRLNNNQHIIKQQMGDCAMLIRFTRYGGLMFLHGAQHNDSQGVAAAVLVAAGVLLTAPQPCFRACYIYLMSTLHTCCTNHLPASGYRLL
jgi:hypothetical protein